MSLGALTLVPPSAKPATEVDAQLSNMTLSEATPIWIELRLMRNLKVRTHESTKGYLEALEVFFGDVRLADVTSGQLREYQIGRQANQLTGRASPPWKRTAGASLINHELNALSQIFCHCRLWGSLKPYYQPLSIAAWSPREVLSEQDEEHLFTIASGNSDVQLAYWVAAITNNTTASGCELRGLRLEHVLINEPDLGKSGVDHNPSYLYIPREAVKNGNRPRKIPLNATAKLAVEACVRRASSLGSCRPEHYLFPFRIGPGRFDPMRQPSRWWLRDIWNKLRTLAELPSLCPHDLRHLAITRMLEAGIPDDTVQAVAGHVSRKMMEYYSHIRIQAKMAAVMAIDRANFRVVSQRA